MSYTIADSTRKEVKAEMRRELNTKNRINETYKDSLINSIIDEEWQMFGQVNSRGGRAACQDDGDTFYIMRYSMFYIMSEETLGAYLRFIQKAAGQGRNLMAEKYAYMMEYTDKEYFDRELKSRLPQISKEKERVIFEISRLMNGCQVAFEKRYPRLSRRGRPAQANDKEDVTVNIYMTGELKTWDYEALMLYLKDIMNICANNGNPIVKIQEKTVQMYGYRGLDNAEGEVG